ncbi:hypothetical protein BDL97_03G042200 [Sphagnum fallax]|nr:hypothetical protein BDL97_03G042200 [Sphagnum fallax]
MLLRFSRAISGVWLLIVEMNRDWAVLYPHHENREGYKEMVQKVNDLCGLLDIGFLVVWCLWSGGGQG